MKANEVRVGNWLDLKGMEFRLDAWLGPDFLKYQKEDRQSLYTTLDSLNGIPLTEEWLLRFGFEHHHDTPHPNRVFRKNRTEGHFELEEIINFFFGGACYSVEVKYVHQLQDLYFALTGQELELKPETTQSI